MKKYVVKIKDVKIIKDQLRLVCDELGISDRIDKADLLKIKNEYNKLAEADGIELEFIHC